MAYLVLVRHGESEWNALGLWTGHRDIPLTEKGIQEARDAAKQLGDIELHKAYTSKLKRAQQTLGEIKAAIDKPNLETIEHPALNERDYGDYTAKNKWEVRDNIGEIEFQKLRRNWDYPVPNGETLKDVHKRVIPYFEEYILKDLKEGKNIIIAAHGNSLRALVKELDNITDEDVHTLEIGTGEMIIYDVSESGETHHRTRQ